MAMKNGHKQQQIQKEIKLSEQCYVNDLEESLT